MGIFSGGLSAATRGGAGLHGACISGWRGCVLFGSALVAPTRSRFRPRLACFQQAAISGSSPGAIAIGACIEHLAGCGADVQCRWRWRHGLAFAIRGPASHGTIGRIADSRLRRDQFTRSAAPSSFHSSRPAPDSRHRRAQPGRMT